MQEASNPSVRLVFPGQAATSEGLYVSHWEAGQSDILSWSPQNVRTDSSGAIQLVLSSSGNADGRPFQGGEVQSIESATTGTWSWTAQAPELVSGSVFGLFAYRADHFHDPWIEFDFELLGQDAGDSDGDGDVDIFQARLNIRMETAAGELVSLEQANNWQPVMAELGFDATEGQHTYAIIVTSTEAIFLVDGSVVGQFDRNDMPYGTWTTGEMKGFANLWSADPSLASWAGEWVYPGQPLVATISGMEVWPGDLGGF